MDQEYIKTLSEKEKIIFIKLFCCLMKSDNDVNQEEISFLKSITQKYGVDKNTTLQIIKNVYAINYMQEASQITNRAHALELLKELCFLANVDNELHDRELEIIINTARAMHIEDEKLILINRFVLDSLILYKTGCVIMEKENAN